MFSLRIPVATYRLQFNRQFRFEDAQTLVPYLYRLGISDLYASPILKARSGSSHGYNVTDPSQLNPELGTGEEFETLIQTIKQHEMGLLLDIVPNHMAASPENPWWSDLLENGLCSPYAAFFDINWSPADSAVKNKVLLPILGRPYEQALENQEFTLTLENAGLSVRYHEWRLPLDVKSYRLVFSHRLDVLETALGAGHPSFRRLKQFLDAMGHLPSCTVTDLGKTGKQYRERQAIKERLWRIVNTSPEIKTFLVENIALFNGKRGDPRSFELLDRLLEQQAYRLVLWKTAYEQINYRRFFDINDLIGVRVEEPDVFEATHALIFQLIRKKKVTGLRIDHVDGLHDPLEYLSRLQHRIVPEAEETGKLPGFYVVVEKILSGDETLPEEWPVFGTTGYDFLTTVNALVVDSKGVQTMYETYSRFTGSRATFDDVVYEKKRQVIDELFPGELRALGQHLAHLAQQARRSVNLSLEELTKALIEITACLPVYRTYIRTLEVSPRDRLYLDRAVQEAKRRNPAMDATALDFLRRVLSLDFPDYLSSGQRKAWLHFVLRWQQLAGAIMAKGFEDTALYTYNPLISLNEVGGAPDCAGLSVDEFHHRNLARLKLWPNTLNATSTHDTKRGEDVRARINVLSEIPEEWQTRLTQWSQWNQAKKGKVNGLLVPEPNMEILLYQTLLGAWPLSAGEAAKFKKRLNGYAVKAAREAKVFTDWLRPDRKHEDALTRFIESILEISVKNKFLEDFLQFQEKVAYYGALNSLAQVLLKITSPGVPDFYQGTELWDLSLVDPDNRRPVDFEKRKKLVDDLIRQEARGQQLLARRILKSWQDGRVKLYVTYKTLNSRRACRDLFEDGDYIPLQLYGQRQEHICAFIRRKGDKWALIAVPRFLTKLVGVGVLPCGQQVWRDDVLLLPEDAPKHWINILTGENLRACDRGKDLTLSEVLHVFPVALLTGI